MSEETTFSIKEPKDYPPTDVYFQFDDDEPFLIQADITGEYSMILSPTGQEVSIEFYQNEKRFKLFLKPKS